MIDDWYEVDYYADAPKPKADGQISGSESMKDIAEEVKEIDPFAEWEKEREEQSDFFKPKIDEKYDIVIGSFDFSKRAFKEGEVPKWTITVYLLFVNGKPTSQKWDTSSRTIIEAIRPYQKYQEDLQRVIWRLRKMKKDDKTTYIFEDIGRVAGQPAPSKAEAFI